MVSPNVERSDYISYNDEAEFNSEARIGSAGHPMRPVVVENFAGEINHERRRMTSANFHHSGSAPRGAKIKF